MSRLRGRALQKMRQRVRQEQPLCGDCESEGKVRAWDELDHTIALEHGGSNDRDNLAGLCRAHHLDKTARDRGFKSGCGADGMPTDPHHHWRVDG